MEWHVAAVEPPESHKYRCPNDQGGIVEEDSAHCRGTLEEYRYLSWQGGEWCAPAAILRRNYSVKEELTSQEGCMSLDRERWFWRRPRHKGKQERDIALMPWAWTLSDNGVLCLDHRVSKVLQLQLMFDPWARSVHHLSLYISTLLVRVLALAIGHWMFAITLSSNNWHALMIFVTGNFSISYHKFCLSSLWNLWV